MVSGPKIFRGGWSNVTRQYDGVRRSRRICSLFFALVMFVSKYGLQVFAGRNRLRSREPVVALVLPVAAGIGVGDGNGFDVLGTLETELGRYPQPHRGAPFGS